MTRRRGRNPALYGRIGHRLAEQNWQSEAIADVLGVHVETVRQVIKDFNKGGIDAIAPRPRSGGR